MGETGCSTISHMGLDLGRILGEVCLGSMLGLSKYQADALRERRMQVPDLWEWCEGRKGVR